MSRIVIWRTSCGPWLDGDFDGVDMSLLIFSMDLGLVELILQSLKETVILKDIRCRILRN